MTQSSAFAAAASIAFFALGAGMIYVTWVKPSSRFRSVLRKMAPKLSCITSALALAGYASAQVKPCSPLGTSACGGHVENVARDVAGWHNTHQANCPYVRPLSAQIVQERGKNVVEHWTIEACDERQFTYRAFLMARGGGLSVMVSDVRPDDLDAP